MTTSINKPAKHTPMFSPSVKYMVEHRPSGDPSRFYNFNSKGFDTLESAHDALKQNRGFLCSDPWVTDESIEAKAGEAFIYKVETKVSKVSVCPPLTKHEVKSYLRKALQAKMRELNKEAKSLEASMRKSKATK